MIVPNPWADKEFRRDFLKECAAIPGVVSGEKKTFAAVNAFVQAALSCTNLSTITLTREEALAKVRAATAHWSSDADQLRIYVTNADLLYGASEKDAMAMVNVTKYADQDDALEALGAILDADGVEDIEVGDKVEESF